ncbi:uncharacterized protein LOC111039706 [Myzus persicae]|uniref:uncharacterized protein LOC111039706 n=1 Tax=Myzus persicae TaxID=13164 RepID=UPI000B935EFE|nr:uncharacterized protein LOC111039706 [Myzus persicae]
MNTMPLHSSAMYDIVELGLSPTRSLEDDIMNNQSKIIQEFYRDIDSEYNSAITSTSSSIINGEDDIMPPMHLILHRGNVFVEMIEAFKSIDKQKCSNLMVELILPNGESEKGLDAGGVFRDTISEFWITMYETCTVGTNVKIPCIRHDFKEEEWKSMAKILYVGWVNSKYLPIKLAMPIIEQMLYGHVTSKLIPTFLLSLGESDNQILNSALKDVDKDDLLEAFSTLECRIVPNEYNIVELLEEISHKELIQKPHFIIEQFRKELKEVRMNTLISENDLLALYKSMEPTAKNILNILSCHETSNDEIKTFGFLKKFIKETTNEIRLKFLRFSTGADVITHNYIKVEFTNVVGLARAPVAHTCSGVLELPSKYEYFADFRKELNSILASNIWVMDIL